MPHSDYIEPTYVPFVNLFITLPTVGASITILTTTVLHSKTTTYDS